MESKDGYQKGGPPQRGRPHPILVALATIGALALIMAGLFFVLVMRLTSGVIEVSQDSSAPGIGVVEVEGVIADSEPILKVIREYKRRDYIKAVIVRINSPGGAVGASQEIFEALCDLDKKKPVVASLETVAASGGYYVAIGARKIVANPGTITGSIGVIMKLPNIGPLLERLGIETQVLKSGAYKDMGSMTKAMTEEEKLLAESVLKDIHNQFMEDVSRRRSIPMKKMVDLAQGQIFSGKKAKALGLVDVLGNFDVAIREAQGIAGLKGEPRLIYPEKGRLKFLKEILEEGATSSLRNILERVVF